MSFDGLSAEERSRHARDLIDHPFFQYVMERLERSYVEAWKQSARDDWDAREGAHARLHALYEFRADLESIATESAIKAFNRRSREVI